MVKAPRGSNSVISLLVLIANSCCAQHKAEENNDVFICFRQNVTVAKSSLCVTIRTRFSDKDRNSASG